MARGWKGKADLGSRTYEPHEYERVVATMREYHVGRENRVESKVLEARLGIGGRTIRAILSDADGREFVTAESEIGDGVFIAECAEDAEARTRRLESQARKIAERAERRRSYGLPERQPTLL